MFELPNTKMFRDSIHGYIDIPKCFVENIIDTDMFQRLRNIDQTGMRVLYPTAKHDRFGHSLGVYYLGSKAVNTILEHFSQDNYWRISSDGKAITFWANNKVLFLLACLLHDIGHTPFSHSLEAIVLNNSYINNKRFSDALISKIRKLEKNKEIIKSAALSNAKPHEMLGAMIILEKMQEPINKIFKELNANKYPRNNSNDFLYAEHYSQNTTVNDYVSNEDLAFIARMVLGLKYSSYEPEKQIRNCFIELLNGEGFDVDKLDYIIRDTKMSGISNIDIDTERLLNALFIVTKTIYDKTECDIKISNELLTTSIFNTEKDKSFHIKGFFRGVIDLEANAKVIIHKGSTIISLTSNDAGKINFSAVNTQGAGFVDGAKVYQDSVEIVLNTLFPKSNNVPFDIKIYNAELDTDFSFCVCVEKGKAGSIKLSVNGECDIEISGTFKTESPVRFFSGSMSGYITRIEAASNIIKNEVPKRNCYNEFSIGYKKQAINVIANVMEARDYLYLWVYAHHKVVYYANFLIPIISDNILPIAENYWALNYNNLELLDDSYVWTKTKELYHQKPLSIEGELYHLCSEFFSRKYRLSLYKSLAEYDLLFEEIPVDKRYVVKNFFMSHLNKNKEKYPPHLVENKAGYFSNELVEYIKKTSNGKLKNIEDIVFVDASYESKHIDANKTLIVTNNTIASLGEIPLLAKEPNTKIEHNPYFYIYYKCKSLTNNCAEEAIALKKVIKNLALECYKDYESLESELSQSNTNNDI